MRRQLSRAHSLDDLADSLRVTGQALGDWATRARGRYFAVEASEVLERLKAAMIPFKHWRVDGDLPEALRAHPDLYGLAVAPSTAVTMILLSPASRGEWGLTLWLACCAVVFSLTIVSIVHAGISRAAGAAAGNWLQLACLLGYSLAPHALAAVMLAALAPPAWIAAAGLAAAATSGASLVSAALRRAEGGALRLEPRRRRVAARAAVAGLHVGAMLGLLILYVAADVAGAGRSSVAIDWQRSSFALSGGSGSRSEGRAEGPAGLGPATGSGGGAGGSSDADGQRYTVEHVKRAFGQERQLALKMRIDRLANMVDQQTSKSVREAHRVRDEALEAERKTLKDTARMRHELQREKRESAKAISVMRAANARMSQAMQQWGQNMAHAGSGGLYDEEGGPTRLARPKREFPRSATATVGRRGEAGEGREHGGRFGFLMGAARGYGESSLGAQQQQRRGGHGGGRERRGGVGAGGAGLGGDFGWDTRDGGDVGNGGGAHGTHARVRRPVTL